MDFSEGFCTEKFLHPQNSQRGVQAEDPVCIGTKKKCSRGSLLFVCCSKDCTMGRGKKRLLIVRFTK